MAKVDLPYVKWRNGRPRFSPGPRERLLGFDDQDLRHGDEGAWFTLDETSGWAKAKHTEIVAARASGRRLRRPTAPKGDTVRDLLEQWLKSRRFQLERAAGGYADETKADYRAKAAAIFWQPQTTAERQAGAERVLEPFVLTPARMVTPDLLTNDDGDGFVDNLQRVRGQTMARQCLMTMSAAWKWSAKQKTWRLTTNPCVKLGVSKPRPLAATWEPAEILAAIAFADHPAIAEPEIADAIVLTLFTGGERERDVLAFTGAHRVNVLRRLPSGATVNVPEIHLVQSKRQRRLEKPEIPPLAARLDAMATRRIAKGYICDELVVDGRTGVGFKQKTFQHRFADLMARAAAGRADLGLAPCPTIAGKTYGRLRGTVLTWIKRAGAGDAQFAAVSGHSLASLPTVMPHYYAPGVDEAHAAMALLWPYMQKLGVAG